MQIEEIHIPIDLHHQFVKPIYCSAWYGFTQRGYHVQLKTLENLQNDLHFAKPEILIFAGVEITLKYLAALNRVPIFLDYPVCLHQFLNRNISKSTLGDIRKQFGKNENSPVFIKPITQKRFTGHVVNKFRDLLATIQLSDDEQIYTSSVVEFLSEWRCFIHKNEVVNISNYKGNPTLFPNLKTILNMVTIFQKNEAPIAYGLDVGVTSCGTWLVEVNDMYSLGGYGLPPLLYSLMIEDRWKEMIKG